MRHGSDLIAPGGLGDLAETEDCKAVKTIKVCGVATVCSDILW